jgi:hypothetical protein
MSMFLSRRDFPASIPRKDTSPFLSFPLFHKPLYLSLSRTSSSQFNSSLPSQSYLVCLHTPIPPICVAWFLWFRRSRFECFEMYRRIGSDRCAVMLRTKKSQTHGVTSQNTAVPPYPRVIRSKTYRGYVKPRIILNAIHNVIFL